MLKGTPGITQIWSEIGPALSQLPAGLYVVTALGVFIVALLLRHSMALCGKCGSEKALRRFAPAGHIMLFVAVQVVWFLSSAIYRAVEVPRRISICPSNCTEEEVFHVISNCHESWRNRYRYYARLYREDFI